jgi:hypothetical protein
MASCIFGFERVRTWLELGLVRWRKGNDHELAGIVRLRGDSLAESLYLHLTVGRKTAAFEKNLVAVGPFVRFTKQFGSLLSPNLRRQHQQDSDNEQHSECYGAYRVPSPHKESSLSTYASQTHEASLEQVYPMQLYSIIL